MIPDWVEKSYQLILSSDNGRIRLLGFIYSGVKLKQEVENAGWMTDSFIPFPSIKRNVRVKNLAFCH